MIGVPSTPTTHNVQVFERGIRSPPNVARLFSQLPKVTSVRQRTGSGLEFIDGRWRDRTCTLSSPILFHAGRTARTVGTSEFFDNIMRDLGSNFYMGSVSIFVSLTYTVADHRPLAFAHHAVPARSLSRRADGPQVQPGSCQLVFDGVGKPRTAFEVWRHHRRRLGRRGSRS